MRPPAGTQAAHQLLPNSVYQEVLTRQVEADVDFEGWAKATGTLPARFIDFPRGHGRS